jgi:beta-galactosidase
MKAGGVQVVSTYIFWIHHEEIEGQFDWTGQRDLRHFVELCKENGLYVYLRIGPWDHGEARNGGFPDWLLNKKIPLRRNDPQYLKYVSRFYGQIGSQIKGLLWQDGGPILGVQIENEYGDRPRRGRRAPQPNSSGWRLRRASTRRSSPSPAGPATTIRPTRSSRSPANILTTSGQPDD